MFDPIAAVNPKVKLLSDEQKKFVSRYFSKVISDEILAASILEKNPVPEEPALSLKPLDGDVVDLLAGNQTKFAKKQDSGYLSISRRIRFSLGPLFQLWNILGKARKANCQEPVDCNKLVTLVEQTVVCLGQASQSVDHQRRMSLMTRIIPKPKKCLEILARNDKVLKKSKELFGAPFYTALHKYAKGNKKLREAKRELQSFKRRSGPQHRPFRQGPPQQQSGFRGGHRQSGRGNSNQNRGAGNTRGRGRGSFARRNDRYVQSGFVTKCTTKKRNHTIRFSEFTRHLWANRWFNRTHKAVGSGRHNYQLNRGEANPVPIKLVSNHSGQLGTTSDKRVLSGMVSTTNTDKLERQPTHVSKSTRTDRSRGTKTSSERSSRTMYRNKRSVHQSSVSETKKGRHNASSLQFEETEQVHHVPTFQNGRYASCGRFVKTGRLADKNRSKGRLLCSSNSADRSQISEISMEEQNFPIQSSPIRNGISAKSVYKNTETGARSVEASRSKTGHMARRHHIDAPESSHGNGSNKDYSVAAAEARLPHKHREVSTDANKTVRVHRVQNQHCHNETVSSRRENSENPTGMPRSSEEQIDDSEKTGKIDRKNDSSNSSHPSSPTAVSPLTKAKSSRIETKQSELRSNSNPESRMHRRTQMVGGVYKTMEREKRSKSLPGHSNSNGCKQNRLGGSLWQGEHPRSMDNNRENTAHKCTGIKSSSVCSKSIHKDKGEMSCTHQGGQHHNDDLHKSYGGNEIPNTNGDSQRIMDVLHIQADHAYSRTCPGNTEPDSRLSQSELCGQQQLETECSDFPGSEKVTGTNSHRSVCRQNECSNKNLHQLETRSGSIYNRRIHNTVDKSGSVCFSTILLNREMSGENQAGSGHSSNSDTDMANTTVVPGTSGIKYTGPNLVTSDTESFDLTNRGESSINTHAETDSSSMEDIGEDRPSKGLSDGAKRLLEQTRRPGSKRTYATPWEKWVSWCEPNELDPVQASVENIANFLSEIHETPVEYATLNVYRSAISAYHPQIEGYKVGQHPMIKELMRGAFNAKPPKPRYKETWDVGIVLRYLKDQEPVETLDLKELTPKLAMLMALVSAARSHELCCLDINFMQDHGHKIVFAINKLTKSRRQGRPHQNLIFSVYDNNEDLDVVRCLRQYLKITKKLRQTEAQKQQLFLACVKPHNPIVPCTIARWLKAVMEKAGIDIGKYKAHSVRGAVTSKANKLGLSTKQIMDRANWAKARTFFRFYNRDVQQTDEFQSKVLA